MTKSKPFLYRHWSILLAILLTPLLLYLVLPILPTHDDWAGTTKPDFNPFFIKERFLFYGYHWRPFDTMIGWIVGLNPQVLYPSFNHYLVVFGHLLCSILIYILLTKLKFSNRAKNITTLLFFLAPATMATVTAIDSQNQVYAHIVDIIAFLCYIKLKKGKYIVCFFLIFLATLCKENGLMWALICPILAFGFDFIDKQTLKKDILFGIGIVFSYFIVITLLPKDIIIHPEYVPDIIKMIKNFIKFIFTSFITVDYIYLLHQPSRNILFAGITFLLTLPFFYYIYINDINKLKNKKIVCTIICLLIAVGPHIITVFSMMHTYAGMGLIAIITAYSIDKYEVIKPIIISFILFIVSALYIDLHLIDESVKSGLIGKKMAIEAIHKTGSPVKNVKVIIIEDDYPKLSSFCVIPNEAFGWGLATKYETNYKWPEEIKDTTIARTSDAIKEANKLAIKMLDNGKTDCVWIVDHKNIDVVKK